MNDTVNALCTIMDEMLEVIERQSEIIEHSILEKEIQEEFIKAKDTIIQKVNAINRKGWRG